MKRAASNGHEQNVSVITAPRAASHFSEVHKPAEHARNQSLTNWMDLFDGKLRSSLKKLTLRPYGGQSIFHTGRDNQNGELLVFNRQIEIPYCLNRSKTLRNILHHNFCHNSFLHFSFSIINAKYFVNGLFSLITIGGIKEESKNGEI
jgi:hypothetical protein